MAQLASALVQVTGPDQPTGLLVALAVVFAAVLLLALRGIVDWMFGPESPTETYRLLEFEGNLALSEEGELEGNRLVGIDEAAMDRLLEAVEHRNELRLHTIVTPAGEELAWETWRQDAEREKVQSVVIEDSKGLVEIGRAGRVTATPPLDEAVRRDLIEVLEDVLLD